MAKRRKGCPTRHRIGYAGCTVRRPSKTELELVIVAACMLVPAGYWIVRTVFALLG